jgi:hypothetical protein
MTDARDIIAYTIPGTNAELCFGLADAIVERLTAAGYRILGLDEVDPVTVEKAARIADEQANEEDGAEGFLASKTIEDAIRSLGRKA